MVHNAIAVIQCLVTPGHSEDSGGLGWGWAGFSESCSFNSTVVIFQDGTGQTVETGSQNVKDRHTDFKRDHFGSEQSNQDLYYMCHFNNCKAVHHLMHLLLLCFNRQQGSEQQGWFTYCVFWCLLSSKH